MKSSQELKEALNQQLDQISVQAKEYGRMAALGTGVLVGLYLAFKVLSIFSQKGNNQTQQLTQPGMLPVPVKQSSFTPVVGLIGNAILGFLLGIARQRLVEYLEQQEKKMRNKPKSNAVADTATHKEPTPINLN